jgi:hypothetical protein
VGIIERLIERQRFERRRLSLRGDFSGRDKTERTAERRISLRERGISLGVIRVFINRLLEILDGFPKALFRRLTPDIATFEIKLVGFRVFSVSLRQMLLFFAAEFQRQRAR